MRIVSHQRSLVKFMNRSGIERYLRFAAVVAGFQQFINVEPPFYLNEDIKLASDGRVVILEFALTSLDDPRYVVMDRLQQFADISSTRTFFGVNYGYERPLESGSIWSFLESVKIWAGPLLSLRRLFGG